MIGLGLRLGMGRGDAGGGSGAVNIVAPSIDANQYAGGPYSFSKGVWTGSPTLVMTLESSADGLSGWADEGVVATVGAWDVSLAGLFVRLKVTPDTGSPAYSAVFGALGPAYNQVVDFAGNSNRINHTVTAPFIGADLSAATSGAAQPGFWLMAMWYYDGAGLETGAALVSLGDLTSGLTHAEMSPVSMLWRAGGGTGGAGLPSAVSAPGWYVTTGHYYNVAATHTSTMWVNDQTNTRSPAVAGAIALTNFTTLRIGDQASNAPSNATNFDERIGYVAFGRGNPGAAHNWTYNSGNIRRVDGYDFGADADATIDGFIPLYRESPGNTTFVVGAITDTIGGFDSWTLDGALVYQDRLPGFINPAGDPPATPSRYLWPRYATTIDTNITLCINTKKIGDAVAGDFTVTALTHSVAGDISGTVSGITFPNPGAGTVTGTISGVSVTSEIVVPLPTVANPQFLTWYNGNARVAQIQPYTSPGAGTTYANIAAMNAAIDALGAGATLIIDDLSDAGTLTLTAKDYGGATIVAENLHGVSLGDVVFTGVSNLTIRGFNTTTLGGNFYAALGVNGVTIDHCTGRSIHAKGTTGATETITVTNWIGPDDGTATQMTLGKFNRVTLHRVAHAKIIASDALRTDQVNTLMADRTYFGDILETNVTAHPDGWQTYLSGTTGNTGGLIIQSVINDIIDSGEIGAQGYFFSGINARNLRIKDCAVRSGLTNSLVLQGADQGCSVENLTANSNAYLSSPASNSALVSNVVKGSAGAVLPTTGAGVETGVLASVNMATAYPQWASHAGAWEQWDNPASGYEAAGAAALIAELAANKVLYP